MTTNSTPLLFLAIVQAQDAEIAESSICELGFNIHRLPSTGGFLGRRNATLLISAASDKEEQIYKTLQENCRQRIEYIAVPLESAPLPLPTPTPVTIGGATILSFEVEHFEVI